MFTVTERDDLREALVAAARSDDDVVGAAWVGSAATSRQDAWSDIDLALQVDLSFWPADRFRATEPGFSLLFGTPAAPTEPAALDVGHQVGMGWLYALHARSALARGRTWQAVMMLDHLRDQVLVLTCLRHDLNPHHGREADRLPPDELEPLAEARASSTDHQELSRSLTALLRCFAHEVSFHDTGLAGRLAPVLRGLGRTAG